MNHAQIVTGSLQMVLDYLAGGDLEVREALTGFRDVEVRGVAVRSGATGTALVAQLLFPEIAGYIDHHPEASGNKPRRFHRQPRPIVGWRAGRSGPLMAA